MTYVVTEECIKCKFMDCVDVCPVDCFYEGENMLVIHPDTKDGMEKWLKINTEYADKWPNITIMRDSAEDAEDFNGEENKFEKYFSEKPGEGD